MIHIIVNGHGLHIYHGNANGFIFIKITQCLSCPFWTRQTLGSTSTKRSKDSFTGLRPVLTTVNTYIKLRASACDLTHYELDIASYACIVTTPGEDGPSFSLSPFLTNCKLVAFFTTRGKECLLQYITT